MFDHRPVGRGLRAHEGLCCPANQLPSQTTRTAVFQTCLHIGRIWGALKKHCLVPTPRDWCNWPEVLPGWGSFKSSPGGSPLRQGWALVPEAAAPSSCLSELPLCPLQRWEKWTPAGESLSVLMHFISERHLPSPVNTLGAFQKKTQFLFDN